MPNQPSPNEQAKNRRQRRRKRESFCALKLVPHVKARIQGEGSGARPQPSACESRGCAAEPSPASRSDCPRDAAVTWFSAAKRTAPSPHPRLLPPSSSFPLPRVLRGGGFKVGRVAAVTFRTEPKRRPESPAAASPARPGQRPRRGAPVRAAPARPRLPGLRWPPPAAAARRSPAEPAPGPAEVGASRDKRWALPGTRQRSPVPAAAAPHAPRVPGAAAGQEHPLHPRLQGTKPLPCSSCNWPGSQDEPGGGSLSPVPSLNLCLLVGAFGSAELGDVRVGEILRLY